MPRKKRDSQQDKKLDFKCAELVVLSESKSKNRLTKLRVVRWSVDGKQMKTKLERREFFAFNDSDEPTMGKCTGLGKEDIKHVIANWDEISMFFEN